MLSWVESATGVVGVFLSMCPYSVNVVQADMLAVCGLRYALLGANVGDLIAVLGSVDFVLGSVDLGGLAVCDLRPVYELFSLQIVLLADHPACRLFDLWFRLST